MKCIILLLLSFELSGQCKIIVDEFTKNITIKSKTSKIGKCNSRWVGPTFIKSSIFSVNGNIRLVLYPQYHDIQTIEKGEIIYLKFVDGEIMELVSTDSQVSDHTTGEMFTQGSGITIWYNNLYLNVTISQLEMLKTKPLEKIRVHYSDYEINSPNTVMEQINCVLNPEPSKK